MYNENLTMSTPLALRPEFRPLLDIFPDALILLDNAGMILYANVSAAAMVGVMKDELPGKTLWQSAPQLITTELYLAVAKVTRTRKPLHVEYRSAHTQAWVCVHLSPTSEGIVVFLHEEMESIHQLASRSAERKQLEFLESISEGLAILTPEGLILEINQLPLKDAQARREEVIGKPFSEIPSWSSDPIVQQQLRVAIERAGRGETAYFDARKYPPAGKYRDLAITIAPHLDANKQVDYIICVGRDITQRKQAEEELRDLVDAIPQLVWIMSPDGSAEYCNQRWCDYTNMAPEQALGDGWLQCLHPDDRQHTLAMWQTSIQTGVPYAVEQRLRNGTTGDYRWFLARGSPFKDAHGQIVKWFGTCTDIDDQKRVEEALRQSQERVRILMNSTIIGTFLTEEDEIIEANDTFLRMTGYTQEDLQQRRMNWVRMTPPEYTERTQQAHRQLKIDQYMIPYEKEYVCKDGSRLPILVGGVILPLDPPHEIYFALDNSARKELEQRKDDFLSMVSHELRTPLASLKLQTQMLRKKLTKQDSSNADTALTRMETQLNTVIRLVGELLDLSKIQAGKLEYAQATVNLDELLQEIVEGVQQMQTTHIIVVYGAVRIPLVGDKDRFAQVFLNLISNAIKYSPAASTVEINISTTTETVSLSVRDQGIGIPREQHEKIFERFYRAVAPRQITFPGLGMGLYIVAEIVKHYEGTIRVESEMGKGSTFHVTLPRKNL